MTIIYDDVPVLSEEVKLLFHEINHCHDFQSLQEIWFRGPLLQAQKEHHHHQQQQLLLQQQAQENNFQAKPQYHGQTSFIQSQSQQMSSHRTSGNSNNSQFSTLQQITSYSNNNNNNNNNNNQIRWTDLMNNLSDFEQDTLPDSSDEDESNPVTRKTTTGANNNHHTVVINSHKNNNQQQSTHQNNSNNNNYNNNNNNNITNELQQMTPKFLTQPVPVNQLPKTHLPPPQQPQQQQESQQPKEEVTRTQFSSPSPAGRLLQSPGESSQKLLKQRKRKYSSELLNNNSLMSELVMDHPKTKKSPSHLTPSPITKASPVSSMFSSAAFVDNQSDTHPQPTQLHSFFSNTNDNLTSAILSEELGITSFPITNDDDGNNHHISGSGSKNSIHSSNNYEINNPNNNNNHHLSHEPIPYDEFSLDFTNMSKILSPDELAETGTNNNINNNNVNNSSSVKNNKNTPTMSSAGLFASVMMNIPK
jgi:hypothetical protein